MTMQLAQQQRKKPGPKAKEKWRRFGGWLDESFGRAFDRIIGNEERSAQSMAEILMREAIAAREKGGRENV